MRPTKIVSVRIDDANLTERRAYLDCRLASGSILSLSIPFNDRAPERSPAHNRWRLVVKLAEWHGMTTIDAVTTRLRCIIGKHYKFRLELLDTDQWVIGAGRAIEPFEIFDPDSDENIEACLRALGVATDVC